MHNNKRRIVSVIGIIFALILVLTVSASAISWDGASSGGGGGSTSSSNGGYAVRYSDTDSNLVGYRFTWTDSSGASRYAPIDVFISTTGGANAFTYDYKVINKYSKYDIKNAVNNNRSMTMTTSNSDANRGRCYMAATDVGVTLPATANMGTWQNVDSNLNAILGTILQNASIADMSYGDMILVEPIYEVRIGGEAQYSALTVTEMAVFGRYMFGGDSNGGASSSSGAWGYIAKFTNMRFPNTLYTPDGKGLWNSVSSAAGAQITFDEMINYGFGVGIAYTESTKIGYFIKFQSGCTSFSGNMSDMEMTVGTGRYLTANGFSRNGYNFAYWKATSNINGFIGYYDDTDWVNNLTSSNGDLVYMKAYWNANMYTVRYAANGGTGNTASTTMWYDQTGTLTANGFSRTGYVFSGWNTKTDGTGTNYADKASVKNLTSKKNDTVTLYAQWTPVHYMIIFNGNGASTGITNGMYMAYGSAGTLSVNGYKRSGYSFSGWNTEVNGSGTGYADRASIKNLSSSDGSVITLYAQWAPITYTVQFWGNGASSGTMSIEAMTYDSNTSLFKNAYTKNGYSQASPCWQDDNGNYYSDCQSVKNLSATQDAVIVLHARWEPKGYSFNYNKNSSTATGSMDPQSMSYDKAGRVNTNRYSNNGYYFYGWNMNPGGTGTFLSENDEVIYYKSGYMYRTSDPDHFCLLEKATAGKVINLYAIWRNVQYTVRFDPNGGTGSLGDLSMIYGTSKVLPVNVFTRVGYTFSGWNTKADGSGNVYQDKASVNNMTNVNGSVVTLYAQWVPITYTITYGGNYPTGGYTSGTLMTYDKAGTISANGYVKTGCAFRCWNTKSNGTGTTYVPGQSVINLSSSKSSYVNLYAQWIPATYSVRFDGNGSTGGSTASMSLTYGATKNLSGNGFTRTGYTFVYWNTKADGSGTTYYDKASVKNLTTEDGKVITLYARWKPITYSIAFDPNRGSGWMSNMSMTYDIAKTLTPNSNIRTGYTFTNWNTKADGSGSSYPDKQSVLNLSATAGATVTLYAQWRPVTYTFRFHSNGGTNGSGGSMSDQTMTYNISSRLTSNSFTRTGYRFNYWNTKADGTGRLYYDKQSLMNSASAEGTVIDLYAQWAPITYTVQFWGNGASSGTMAIETMTYDKDASLFKDAYSKNGYSQASPCWQDDNGNYYSDCQSVKNLSATQGAVIVLHARWDVSKVILSLTPVAQNAPYRESTKVVTCFRINNDTPLDCVPDDGISVKFSVYNGSTVISVNTKSNVVVPAGKTNLVYFGWNVPVGLNSAELTITAEIISGDDGYGLVSSRYSTTPFVSSQTPDTQYEKSAPEGYAVPAIPSDVNNTAVWSEWIYDTGTFKQVTYGLQIANAGTVITPATGKTAVRNDSTGLWTMKSGYGISITAENGVTGINGYSSPSTDSYTLPQYASAMFPEYGYSSVDGNYTTLTVSGDKWIFPTYSTYGNVHFTPLWFPDGSYAVSVMRSDCWTPAGMISSSSGSTTITISGSAYDDWYVGG